MSAAMPEDPEDKKRLDRAQDRMDNFIAEQVEARAARPEVVSGEVPLPLSQAGEAKHEMTQMPMLPLRLKLRRHRQRSSLTVQPHKMSVLKVLKSVLEGRRAREQRKGLTSTPLTVLRSGSSKVWMIDR